MHKQSHLKRILSSLVAAGITGLAVGCLVGLSASPTVQAVLSVVMGSVAAIIAAISGIDEGAISKAVDKVLPNDDRLENDDVAKGTSNRADLSSDRRSMNPWPLAIFVLFLLVGSGFGLFARTHNWLGSYAAVQEKAVWTELGFDENEVKDALYSQRFPLSGKAQMLRLNSLEAELGIWESVGVSRTLAGNALLAHIYGPQVVSSPTKEEAVLGRQATHLQSGALVASRTDSCIELRNMIDKYDVQTALSMSLEERWRPLSVISDTQSLELIIEIDLCRPN